MCDNDIMVTGKRGFSLLEIVFAVTLLAGVIFTLGILIPQTLIYTRDTGIDMLAYREAERLMEGIRTMGAPHPSQLATNPAAQFFDGFTAAPPPPGAFPPAPYPRETIQYQQKGVPVNYLFTFQVQLGAIAVPNPSTPYTANYRQVTVTVLWDQNLGGGQTVVRSGGSGGQQWSLQSQVFFE
jgi:hypothetical protein